MIFKLSHQNLARANKFIINGTEIVLIGTSLLYVFGSNDLIMVMIFTCLSYCVSIPMMLRKKIIAQKTRSLSIKSILFCLSIISISDLSSIANMMILITLSLIHLVLGFYYNKRELRVIGLIISLCCAYKLVVIDMLKAASDSLSIALLVFLIGVIFLVISLGIVHN